jgi:hypothetical protein
MSNREIQTLGKSNKTKLRNYFNDVYNLDLKSITQIRKVLGVDTDNEAWAYLQNEFNNEITRERTRKDKIKRFEKKKSTQKKASLISKFFQNYKRPTNMIANVKYNDPMLGIIWEKQYVDVFKIVPSEPIDIRSEAFIVFVREKLLPLLGNLHLRYRGGIIQIDLLGKWKAGDGTDSFDDSPIEKICIPAIELTPRNYPVLMDQIFSHLNPTNSTAYFLLNELEVKFIKPIVGGCYTCKGHGKNLKLKDLTLHNPYSTNNNCFFRVIEEHLDFKPNKNKCNEIRAEFGIKENEVITIQDCYKISKKYSKKTISFITNDMELLYGDEDGDVKVFCLDNHYMSLIGQTKKCNACGQFFMKEHTCNGKVASFYNMKIKRLIERVNKEPSELKNHEILHYDIETHYMNLTHQHTPYIVGFCYYLNGELIYDIIFGDDCMKEFYDFLGSETLNDIKYVNAYNGSGFDHYYLFREKMKSDEKVGRFILNNGNILSAKIKGKTLIDLCRHLTGSLDSNLKQNCCSIAKGKIDHNLSKRWEDTDEERKQIVKDYLKCDVLGLCELYEKTNQPMFDKYKINLCEKLTTSSNAFDIWRDNYLKDKVFLLDAEKDMNVRQAIYGARCYKNKNRFKSTQYDASIRGELNYEQIDDYIFDADVVSLYPTAMSQYPYPIGKEKITNLYQKNKLGIYKITYIAPKNLLNPILPRKEGKKLIWDLNDGSGWYSSVDIENAKSKGYNIKIITGYYWEQSGYIFKDYIDEFYKMKQNSKKGTPAYNLAKLYLNGLYGKMLQRPNHSKDCIIKSAEEFWKLLNKNIIQEMSSVGNTWLVKYISKPEFITSSGAEKPTQLGVFILAYSRGIMNNYYNECGNTMNRLPYYYDTDSLNIHSSCLDKIKIDKNLGGIDDDVGGKVIKAIYIAPKMYAFQYITPDNKLKYHFRGKGVSNDALAWEHFETMDKGGKQDFKREFQMKKINMKKSGKEQDYDHFSHKHIFGSTDENIKNNRVNYFEKDDTKKTINQNIWKGRMFIDENNSVPFGFDLPTLKY